MKICYFLLRAASITYLSIVVEGFEIFFTLSNTLFKQSFEKTLGDPSFNRLN